MNNRGRESQRIVPALCAGMIAILEIACAGGGEPAAEIPSFDTSRREALRARAVQIFGTLPSEVPNDANPITEPRVELGRMLFYEQRLSKNHDIACNSCHLLDNYGVDNEPTSPGHRGQRGSRNSPSVYNAALHIAQFWDGRAADVEEQAKGPILNPIEMAMPSEAAVIAVLASIPGYGPLFERAFPEDSVPLTYDNIARAIGAFERRLLTPSPFDDFIAGDLDALNPAELAGFETFLDTGCTVCHMGPAIGGQLFQKLGLVHPYETEDLGRYEVTGRSADRYFFKVPSLRNVAETAPYFHDGSIPVLSEAVRLMAWHQLGRRLTLTDTASIATFLHSLSGRIDAELIRQPALPASGPATPPPDPT